MQNLVGYGSSDDEAEAAGKTGAAASATSASSTSESDSSPASKRARVSVGVASAPAVDVDDSHVMSHATWAMSRPVNNEATGMVKHNMRADALWGQSQGPQNPFAHCKAAVKEAAVDEAAFDEGLNVASAAAAPDAKRRQKAQRKQRAAEQKEKKAALAALAAGGDGGPWAAAAESEDEFLEDEEEEVTEEQKAYLASQEVKTAAAKKRRDADVAAADVDEDSVEVLSGERLDAKTGSKFHGSAERDYQGRPWTQAPPALRASDGSHDCEIPKKMLHCWRGHSKGVQAIRFLPKQAHLLLSGSLDTTCKIWGVYESSGGGNGRDAKRTYEGHTAPVKALAFNSDGSQFISTSYDKKILLWDVESGAAISSFSNGSVAQCAEFFPLDDHVFLAGCANSRIAQWDVRTGTVVQKYSHHLSAVNTITFFDESRRFLSTADDKKMLVWEWSIPVPIKYIAEPSMQSMPVVTVHPSQQYAACQSMDNRIVTYEVGATVRNYKKQFKGHNSAGYACPIGFSPNGKFIMSGDASGKLFFWDWQSGKKYRELRAHDKHPCIGALWHPTESSWVATCAWDGLIKLWA